jgi:GTP-binding protein
VSGRGEPTAILIETMRREGYEMEVSRPRVILKEVDDLLEPVEEVVVEVDPGYRSRHRVRSENARARCDRWRKGGRTIRMELLIAPVLIDSAAKPP